MMPKKHTIDADDDLWSQVLKHKIDSKFKNINEAVLDLLKKGLKHK